MKNLALLATLLGAGLAQGCIISGDDDDDGGGGVSPCDDRELEGPPGACVDVLVTCPINATEFIVSGVGADVTVDCDVGEAPIVVSPGTYDLVVTPFEGVIEYPSRGETITVADGDILVLDRYVIEAGEMELTWTIGDAVPSPDSCDSAPGSAEDGRLKSERNAPPMPPPAMKPLSMAPATFAWF